jgi:glutamine amidotransferase
VVIAVIDYGVGNLRSVTKALEAVGAEVRVSGKPEDLRGAERIVLPGVGAFASGMANLEARGLVDALAEEVREKGKPLLAICLGMQLLVRESRENGLHKGLGWLPAQVVEFDLRGASLKVPHMGWNEVFPQEASPFFANLGRSPVFYFVHSYHVVCEEPKMVAATCLYGIPFTAALHHDNIFATQFHPEKSQANGLRVLRNFVSWIP